MFTICVEASAAPFDASKQILRVSLDGVRDATPDVAFNDDAVASWHTVPSVGTSLYEMTLRPQTGPNEIIVTARVNSTERVIRRGDLRTAVAHVRVPQAGCGVEVAPPVAVPHPHVLATLDHHLGVAHSTHVREWMPQPRVDLGHGLPTVPRPPQNSGRSAAYS